MSDARRPPDVVLVLAKSPVAGRAKTRLCPPASPTGAARIAAAALLDTLDVVAAVPGARVMVAWTGALVDAECATELRRALGTVEVFAQCDGDLGQRIAAAHAEVARRAPGSAVLQIGMDTPQLDADVLGGALARLHGDPRSPDPRHPNHPQHPDTSGADAVPGHAVDGVSGVDAVLGPAVDGGWWALGLRDARRASVLTDVSMSRPDTGTLTERALRASGLTVEALPELRDVDTAADARIVAAATPHSRFALAVRAVLAVPIGGPC